MISLRDTNIKIDEDFYGLEDDFWFYVHSWYGYVYMVNKKTRKKHKLSRLIMGAKDGEFVDHINHNQLDNRRTNLRICSRTENNRNRRQFNNKKDGIKYKGVYRYNKTNKFYAAIGISGKLKYLGNFSTDKDAAMAYDKEAKIHFGKFACLNINK